MPSEAWLLAIVIQAVEAAPETGRWVVRAAIDGVPTTAQIAANADATCVSIEEEFFLLLSERGLAEVGNSAAYHLSVQLLLRQAVTGERVGVPLALGLASVQSRRRWWQFWRGRA